MKEANEVNCYSVTVVLKGGWMEFNVLAENEEQAIDQAWEALGQALGLQNMDLAADEGLFEVKQLVGNY